MLVIPITAPSLLNDFNKSLPLPPAHETGLKTCKTL